MRVELEETLTGLGTPGGFAKHRGACYSFLELLPSVQREIRDLLDLGPGLGGRAAASLPRRPRLHLEGKCFRCSMPFFFGHTCGKPPRPPSAAPVPKASSPAPTGPVSLKRPRVATPARVASPPGLKKKQKKKPGPKSGGGPKAKRVRTLLGKKKDREAQVEREKKKKREKEKALVGPRDRAAKSWAKMTAAQKKKKKKRRKELLEACRRAA